MWSRHVAPLLQGDDKHVSAAAVHSRPGMEDNNVIKDAIGSILGWREVVPNCQNFNISHLPKMPLCKVCIYNYFFAHTAHI